MPDGKTWKTWKTQTIGLGIRLGIALLGIALVATGCGPAPNPGTESTRVSDALGGNDVTGYARADRPRQFHFPQDHGPHPDFRNEWWYVTGNLDAEDGRRFGFQFTLFRIALGPRPRSTETQESASAWRTRQVWMAHFAVTDARGRQHHAFERFSRGALGLAGAQAAPFHAWLEDWQLNGGPQADFPWHLSAAEEDVSIDLELVAIKDVVLQGDHGLSRKSTAPGNASYYYSLPRLAARGELAIGGNRFQVTGLAWFDREWSTSALGPDQSGWDWFALQLEDGRDLMFYRLRRLDGTTDPLSGGTLTGTDGEVQRLDASSVRLETLDYWESPGGIRYPAAWRMHSPYLEGPVEIRPVIPDQLMETTVRYWEGAVDVADVKGETIGRGYVELAGYRTVK